MKHLAEKRVCEREIEREVGREREGRRGAAHAGLASQDGSPLTSLLPTDLN